MYLIIVNFYCRFLEVGNLDKAMAEVVIQYCKIIFMRHGIPEEVVMDNGL